MGLCKTHATLDQVSAVNNALALTGNNLRRFPFVVPVWMDYRAECKRMQERQGHPERSESSIYAQFYVARDLQYFEIRG